MTSRTLATTLNDRELSELKVMFEERSGIHFAELDGRLLAACVREYMDVRRIARSDEALRMVRGSESEYGQLLDRVLSRDACFFRWPAVYDWVESRLLAEVHIRKFWAVPRAVRFWSAGCGTGDEAYSVAMLLANSARLSSGWNVQVLATDHSSRMISFAERGVYTLSSLRNLTPRQIQSSFARLGDQFLLKSHIRNMVSFATMDLAGTDYVGSFDCIFCLDVLAKVPENRRGLVIRRFYEALEPGGYLVLGPRDAVPGIDAPLECETIGSLQICRRAPEMRIPPIGVRRHDSSEFRAIS